jgi:hypothetical protein
MTLKPFKTSWLRHLSRVVRFHGGCYLWAMYVVPTALQRPHAEPLHSECRHQTRPHLERETRPAAPIHCGSPTLRTSSANRGSECSGSSKKSVFKPAIGESRS